MKLIGISSTVSHHDPKRLYFGTQRVWRSENRGDDWSVISGDLTKNEERLSLPIMGKVQSFDNAWDVYAMSTYNTVTSLASPQLTKTYYIQPMMELFNIQKTVVKTGQK